MATTTPATSGSLARARARFMGRHECNAYCRGATHAQVFYIHPAADPATRLGDPLAALGWRLMRYELAIEHRGEPDRSTYLAEDGRVLPETRDLRGIAVAAYLVIWEA